MNPPRTGSTASTGSTVLAVVWFALALAGLVGTWVMNLRFMADPQGLGYVEAWFVNPASSSAAVDVLVVALAASVFFVVEGRRLGWRWAWVFVPLSFATALAFAFPLFLGLRELSLRRRASPPRD